MTLTLSASPWPRRRAVLFLALAAPLILRGSLLQAASFTLIDENSSADIDTEFGTDSWEVEGTDNLFTQSFFYRTGAAGSEEPVESLPVGLEGATDVNLDGDDDTLFVRYDAVNFQISIRHSLDGGASGSGVSAMGEQISIQNLTANPIDFHFFQYVDFDLNGGSGEDSAVFLSGNSVQQYEGIVALAETVVSPLPTHRQISVYSDIIDDLQDDFPTTLTDSPDVGDVLDDDDFTWAFQWSFTLGPNATYQIVKGKTLNLVPEPAGILLALVGMGLCAARRRVRQVAIAKV